MYLCGDISVDEPAAGHLHTDMVGVDIVSGGTLGQHHSRAVVRRDVLVPAEYVYCSF
jgi:hypothetical protein